MKFTLLQTCCSVDVKLRIGSCRRVGNLFIQDEKVKICGCYPPDRCTTCSILGYVCIIHLLAKPGAFIVDVSYFDQ